MLSGKQRHYLRGLAHHRKPVVLVGNAGVSDAVLAEIDQALGHHELIKIKLPALEKKDRQQLAQAICEATGADEVQQLGRILVIYRAAPEPGITLPR